MGIYEQEEEVVSHELISLQKRMMHRVRGELNDDAGTEYAATYGPH